jgi:DNA-binding XRE family transcriptional regulator
MNTQTWQQLRPRVVAEVGDDELARAHRRNQAYIDASRLAERRTALGLSQTDVAVRLGITKGRVSQIERGEVSTVDVIARYVQALGGRLQISAIFGDDQLDLRGTGRSVSV